MPALDAGQHAGDRALLALHRLHLRGRRGQVARVSLALAAGPQDDRRDQERRRRRQQHRQDDPDETVRPASGASTAMIEPGAAGARRPGVEDRQGQDAGHAAGDGGEQQ